MHVTKCIRLPTGLVFLYLARKESPTLFYARRQTAMALITRRKYAMVQVMMSVPGRHTTRRDRGHNGHQSVWRKTRENLHSPRIINQVP
jgi:hypothetical protein